MAAVMPETRPFINNEEQIKLFDELVRCEGALRILAITQTAQFGKSELLLKLRSMTALPVLVALVDADPKKGAKAVREPFHFMLTVKKAFEDEGLSFPKTDQQVARFFPAGVVVDLTEANFTGAHDFEVTGAQGNVPAAVLTHEQRLLALDGLHQAFFRELVDHSQSETIAILVDTFEQWHEKSDIYDWFHETFLRRLFFPKLGQLSRIVLIVAGQAMPEFNRFGDAAVADRVKSCRLEPWTEQHAIDYFKKRMGRDPEAREADLLRAMTLNKLAPGEFAHMVDVFRTGQAAP